MKRKSKIGRLFMLGGLPHDALVQSDELVASFPAHALGIFLQDVNDRRLFQSDFIGNSHLRHAFIKQVLN